MRFSLRKGGDSVPRMRRSRTWQGVRMRTVAAAPDPDAEPREVTLPVTWDQAAAAALASFASRPGRVDLERLAESWIGPAGERARRVGFSNSLGERLRLLLLSRRAAPEASLWNGRPNASPGFTLNLASFRDDAGGFDAEQFGDAIEAAVAALAFAAPGRDALLIGVADLAGLLAELGIPYDSDRARDLARSAASLLQVRGGNCGGRTQPLSRHQGRHPPPRPRRGAAWRRDWRHRPGFFTTRLGRRAFANRDFLARRDRGNARSRARTPARWRLALSRGRTRRLCRDDRCGRALLPRHAVPPGESRDPAIGLAAGIARPASRIHAEGIGRRPQAVPPHGGVCGRKTSEKSRSRSTRRAPPSAG